MYVFDTGATMHCVSSMADFLPGSFDAGAPAIYVEGIGGRRCYSAGAGTLRIALPVLTGVIHLELEHAHYFPDSGISLVSYNALCV